MKRTVLVNLFDGKPIQIRALFPPGLTHFYMRDEMVLVRDIYEHKCATMTAVSLEFDWQGIDFSSRMNGTVQAVLKGVVYQKSGFFEHTINDGGSGG